ncbi:MAG: HAD family hydrolase [bacterium]
MGLRVIRAVLFDLGDTVFKLNPMADVTDEYAKFLGGEGVADSEAEAVRVVESLRKYWAGYGRGQLEELPIAEIASPFIGSDARADRFAARLDALLAEADVARWEAGAGRDELFSALRAAGIRVGFVSNTLTAPDLMRGRLEEFELLHHAEVAVFSVEHRVRKPNPEIFRIALRGLGLEPTEVVFVGDRVREDVRGPQSLGMRSILTHEFRQEDPADSNPFGVVQHLSEVVGLVTG